MKLRYFCDWHNKCILGGFRFMKPTPPSNLSGNLSPSRSKIDKNSSTCSIEIIDSIDQSRFIDWLLSGLWKAKTKETSTFFREKSRKIARIKENRLKGIYSIQQSYRQLRSLTQWLRVCFSLLQGGIVSLICHTPQGVCEDFAGLPR